MMKPLDAYAEALADSRPVDWASEVQRAVTDHERATIEAFRDLAALRNVFTTVADAPVRPRHPRPVLSPGSDWGGLRIVGHIGRGRFGEVYRAWDPALERDVALKLIYDETGASNTQVIDEGRLMARVRHANVVAIHGAQRIAGVTGLWMAYLEGRTLEAELAEHGPFTADELVRVALDLSRALAAVHQAGLVHRDVKTTNVIRDAGGPAVLGDFGTVRGLHESEHERIGLTGTPPYLAPEIFEGKSATSSSDLYSLGVLIYRLATGSFPVAGRSLREIRDSHRTAPPATLKTKRPDLPEFLVEAIDRLLEADTARRFQSARVFEDAVASAQTRIGRSRHRWTRIAAMVGAIVLGALAVLVPIVLWRDPGVMEVGRHTSITSSTVLELDPSLSPDGRFIAYSAGLPGRMRILVQDTATGQTRPLTAAATGDERRPHWSPDGRSILFAVDGKVLVAQADGGAARTVVAHTSQVRSAVWSPTGENILLLAEANLYRVPLSGGPLEVVRDVTPDAAGLAVSPDETRIAYVTGNQDFAIGTTQFANIAPSVIRVASIAGGPATDITPATVLSTSPAWSVDGRSLLYVSNREGHRDIYLTDIDASGQSSQAKRLTSGLDAHSIDLGATGTLIYSKFMRRANVWSVDVPARGAANLRDAVRLTEGSQTIEGYVLSPDEHWLYFDSNQHGNADLFRAPLAGGPTERLTDDPGDEFMNHVSPDGTELVFHTFRNSRREVFVMPAVGGKARFVSPGLGASWSPDGSRLLVNDEIFEGVGAGTTHRVLRRTDDGGWVTDVKIDDKPCSLAHWTREGRLVALCGGAALELRAADGTILRAIYQPREDTDPSPRYFAVAGDDVIFKSYEPDGAITFWTFPINGGSLRLVLRLPPDADRRANRREFRATARRIYFTLEEFESDIWSTTIGSGR